MVLLWFLGIFYTLFRGTWADLIGTAVVGVDLVTLLIAYITLSYGNPLAGVFAVTQGVLVDIFSQGWGGVFTVLYLVVFGGIVWGRRYFNLQETKGQIVIIALAVAVRELIFVGLLGISAKAVPWEFLSVGIVATAALTALVGPVLFEIFDRMKGAPSEDLEIV